MFCSLMSFCLSLLALFIVTSRAGWPLLNWSTTKKTVSSSSLMAYLCTKNHALRSCPTTQSKKPSNQVRGCGTVFYELYLLSFGLRKPPLNLSTTVLNIRLASLAKSRSRISMTGTETMANASLSSLVGQVPS